jgi:DNA repair protein RadD
MTRTQLRPYQRQAIDALTSYWVEGGGNGLIDMATGLGKSVVVATICKEIMQSYPGMRLLTLVDSKELVGQNYKALLRAWPEAPVGVYAAGLGRRDAHNPLTFASIQSVYKRAKELGPRDLILVDEAHMIPPEGEGMYRTLLDGLKDRVPDLRVGGLSATCFRLKGGRLDGPGNLFDDTVYSYGLGKGIDDGWLVPLVSRNGSSEIDVSSVSRRGTEFVPGALNHAAEEQDDVVRAAVADMKARAHDRKSWLIFACGVKHANRVADVLKSEGVNASAVSGDSPNRDQLIEDFKCGRLDALCNADLLTKGFDAPRVDLIAMLRPTLSPGLLIQIVGRGTRPVWPAGFDENDPAHTSDDRRTAIASSAKPDCLVLDYAGNFRRHGPVDTISAPDPKRRGASTQVRPDDIRAKECPTCKSLAALNAQTCAFCGHEWTLDKARHDAEADDVAILSRDLRNQPPEEIAVVTWMARRHVKAGSPDSLRVTYSAGLMSYPEWVLLGHKGPGRYRAEKWWVAHGGRLPVPDTIEDALVRWSELSQPAFIGIQKNGKWWNIVSRRFTHTQEQAA